MEDLRLLSAVCFICFLGLVGSQQCPPVDCRNIRLPESCRTPSYFASRRIGICRGCDVCIEPGSPEDSKGCPLMPCTKTLRPKDCLNPYIYNRWVVHKGRRCPTCTAILCSIQ